ncbi:MAG: SdrD B-like domain-containing protein [Propioniciclava sp.]
MQQKSTTRRWGRLAAAFVLAAVMVAGGAPKAWAAPITPVSGSLEITATDTTVNAGWGTKVTFELAFTTPNDAAAGDTFEIYLPEILNDWPTDTVLAKNSDGVVGYEVNILPAAGGNPAKAVFRLTAAGADIDNLGVVAEFGSSVGGTSVGTYPSEITDTVTGATLWNGPIVVTAPTNYAPRYPYKNSWFADGGQCRVETDQCLEFVVGSESGATGTFSFTDTAANWQFDCEPGILVRRIDVEQPEQPGNTVDYKTVETIMPGDSRLSCSAGGIELTYDVGALNLGPDEHVQFMLLSDAVVPGGSGLVTYANTAEISSNGVPRNEETSSRSAYFGARVTGDGIDIIKRDEVGNDAQDAGKERAGVVDLSDSHGATTLDFVIRNSGTTDLSEVTVSDAVTDGSGSVSNLTCTVPGGEVIKAGADGTVNWAGTFAAGADFSCSADLSGVAGPHRDLARVTATGNGSVSDEDEYNATAKKPVSIGDYVWFDADADGVQDGTEKPASGVTVTLYKADGATQVGATSTDADGFYSFTDLTPASDYVVVFTAPDGYLFTTQTVGSDTAVDSNPGTDGRAPVTTPAEGDNSATTPDDPTIDAGLIPVSMNLVLAKELVGTSPFEAGDTVEFTLTPSNDGNSDAVAGWSVTDVLPEGLTLTGLAGEGYTCDVASASCVSETEGLASGATGNPITVSATLDDGARGTLHNVAYVSPDSDDIEETNPLVVPTTGTDTDATDTDNDAQADLTVAAEPVAAVEEPTTPEDAEEEPQTPSGAQEEPQAPLAYTGSNEFLGLAGVGGLALLVAGGVLLRARRGH